MPYLEKREINLDSLLLKAKDCKEVDNANCLREDRNFLNEVIRNAVTATGVRRVKGGEFNKLLTKIQENVTNIDVNNKHLIRILKSKVINVIKHLKKREVSPDREYKLNKYKHQTLATEDETQSMEELLKSGNLLCLLDYQKVPIAKAIVMAYPCTDEYICDIEKADEWVSVKIYTKRRKSTLTMLPSNNAKQCWNEIGKNNLLSWPLKMVCDVRRYDQCVKEDQKQKQILRKQKTKTSSLCGQPVQSPASAPQLPTVQLPSSTSQQSTVGPPGDTPQLLTVQPPASTSQQSTVGPPASISQQSTVGPPDDTPQLSPVHSPASTSHQSIVGPPASTSQQSTVGPPDDTPQLSPVHFPASTSQQSTVGPPDDTPQLLTVQPPASTSQQSTVGPPDDTPQLSPVHSPASTPQLPTEPSSEAAQELIAGDMICLLDYQGFAIAKAIVMAYPCTDEYICDNEKADEWVSVKIQTKKRNSTLHVLPLSNNAKQSWENVGKNSFLSWPLKMVGDISIYGQHKQEETKERQVLQRILPSIPDKFTAQFPAYTQLPAEPSSEIVQESEAKLKLHDFVEVRFPVLRGRKKSSETFLGQVLDAEKIMVKFLKKVSRKIYVWPKIDDICEVEASEILRVMDVPKMDNREQLIFS
ncbi:uncharacterized protein LOC117340326 [Pecten maximus]|uniref:uncharacterized protein LOC117340326 n=1 Tax=Pecten maximus TaxID=6579 RepID=UPI0014588D1D|nr:uncharacterized protein LOC117340326 [Pecten maximus]XP_033757983.1 uncharacterized protein LOC117340326 [Pecten maximus]